MGSSVFSQIISSYPLADSFEFLMGLQIPNSATFSISQLTISMIHVYFSIFYAHCFLEATLLAALLQSYIFFSYSFRDSALVKINITKYSNLSAKGYGIIIREKIYGSRVLNS